MNCLSKNTRHRCLKERMTQCFKMPALLFLLITGIASQKLQAQKVTGIVTGVDNAALSGATVSLKGSKTKTQTDSLGKFSIAAPVNSVLVFSYTGHTVKEVVVTNLQPALVVQLARIDDKLNEVVVVGYGKQKKLSLVSSIATVTGEELSFSGRSLSNNLQGQVAGLISFQRSGEPGYDNSTFWIRGISTFGGIQNPLIMVDGVKRDFNDIDPNEIATFSILKDAAATSVYGAEGANGVILVTTKRGRNRTKADIGYRGEITTQKPLRMPEYANAANFLEAWNEASLNDNNTLSSLPFSQDIIDKYRNNADPDLYPSVNWIDALMKKNTYSTNHNLSFRGGSEKARYFVSGAYYYESGIFKNNALEKYNSNIDLKRYNLRSNIDIDVTKSTVLSVNLAGQYLVTNYPGAATAAIFRMVTYTQPYQFPVRYSDGTISQSAFFDGYGRINPYNVLNYSGVTNEFRTQMQSNVSLTQKLDAITRGLSVTFMTSFDYNGIQVIGSGLNVNTYSATGRDIDGKLIFRQITNGTGLLTDGTNYSNNNKQITLRGQIDYAHMFNSVHDVGASFITDRRDYISNGDRLPFRKEQYIGRLTYVYNKKYSLELNAAYSGSENFAKGHRFGVFPAMGLGWIATNEAFFPEGLKDIISNLKFRFSYGLTGNDQVYYNGNLQRFPYRGATANGDLNRWSVFGLDYTQGSVTNTGGNNGTVYESRFSSPNLTWEKEKKRNYGIDISLLKNKITFTAEYFNNYRYSILLARQSVSGAAGFTAQVYQNFGSVSNKGVDLNLVYNQKAQSSVISFRGNFTFARNRVIEMDEPKNPYPWMNQTGKSLNRNYMYIAEGLFQESDFTKTVDPGTGQITYNLLPKYAVQSGLGPVAPGDIRYRDLNGDGVINAFDRTRDIGHPNTPEITYGFGVSYSYKGFSASVFFSGVANTSMMLLNSGNSNFMPFGLGINQSNLMTIALDRWTPDNPSQDVIFPRLHTGFSTMGNNTQASTWWIRSGAFMRLKNAEINYTIPKNLMKKLGLETAKVYIMGFNLLTFDKLKYWDPEQSSDNAGLTYPQNRKVTLGIELNF